MSTCPGHPPTLGIPRRLAGRGAAVPGGIAAAVVAVVGVVGTSAHHREYRCAGCTPPRLMPPLHGSTATIGR